MKNCWKPLLCSMALAASHLIWPLGVWQADVHAMGDRPAAQDMDQVNIQRHSAPVALPDIEFRDARGQNIRLSQLRGRVVLLNFWATWCPPCIQEMPAFDRLQQRYGQQGLAVIPISQDRATPDMTMEQRVGGFYQHYGLQNLGIFYNKDAAAYSALGIPGLPTTLVIDRNGYERARIKGAIDWESPSFIRELEGLLAGQ